MTFVRALLLLLACAVAFAGCGAEERSAEVKVLPAKSTPAAPPAAAAGGDEASAEPEPTPAESATVTVPPDTAAPAAAAAAVAANPGGASADEAATGGAGDERPLRQTARFTLGAADVLPASVSVAPFLAVALEVVNADDTEHRIKLVGTDVAFEVRPGETATRTLGGLTAGMYTVSVDGGAAAASLVAGTGAGA